MADSDWQVFSKGSSIGQIGSQEGTIVLDEEYGEGARITLERDANSAPFAITCGVYGWMVHTRFFSVEGDAMEQYELMKRGLEQLLKALPSESGLTHDRISNAVESCAAFVDRFP